MSTTVEFKFDIGEHVYFIDGVQLISEGIVTEVYDGEISIRECITRKEWGVATTFVSSCLETVILNMLRWYREIEEESSEQEVGEKGEYDADILALLDAYRVHPGRAPCPK